MRSSLLLLSSAGGSASLQRAIEDVTRDTDNSKVAHDEQLKALESKRNALQIRLRHTVSSCTEIRQVPTFATFARSVCFGVVSVGLLVMACW